MTDKSPDQDVRPDWYLTSFNNFRSFAKPLCTLLVLIDLLFIWQT